jgi:LysR family transcriptional activator of glutamate synthase operon
MEFRQLQYFIEVAKREHVTQASEALHVAQSAVSRQISLLEKELEIALFIREGRNVKLTQMGRLFLTYAERSLNEIELAKQQIQEHQNPEKGLIRLGFSSGLSVQTLPPVLTQFREDYPSLHFQLHQGTLPYLIDLIDKGHIDLAFSAPVPTENPTVKGTILYSENLLALLPVQHPLSEKTTLRLKDLKADRFVTYRTGLALRDIVFKACTSAGFTPEIAFEGEDMDTIKGLVAAGFGVSLVPEHALAHNLPPDLTAVKITDPHVYRTVGLIQPLHRELAPSEELLYRFLVSFYKRLTKFGWE